MEEYYIYIAFSGLLVAISLYGGAITHKHVKATKNRSLEAFALSWYAWSTGYMCVIVAGAVEYFYASGDFDYWKYPIILSFFFQILGVFSLIIFLDENSQASISIVKIIVITIIGSLYIVLPFETDQLQFSETLLYTVTGTLRWVQTAFGLLHFLITLLWVIRIWKHSPKKTKRMTGILLLVVSLSSIIAIGAYIGSGFHEWLLILLYVFHGGARLSIVIAIQMEPQIINILPFVASRVLVINRKSGVPLYEHSWKNEIRKNLSLFIHGIQRVSQETFQVGKLEKLNLGEGLVLLDYSDELTYALLTTKSTKYLQLCFRNFKENFEKKIKELNLKLDGVVDTVDFVFGNALVENYFKYIPSRLID